MITDNQSEITPGAFGNYGIIISKENYMPLISASDYPVRPAIKILLQDKTTKKNIIFATNAYKDRGPDFGEANEITVEKLAYMDLLPRVEKELAHQQARTKAKAEVFTPSWVCNKMNNHCDEEWFGRPGVFNVETENGWEMNTDRIEFGELSWKDYVDSRRIEITCGEAPYIVSRYDTTTGDIIPVPDRIGILDRKLRVVNENASDDKEWLKWSERAFQSVYGYEYQGDNLLIARINLLNTYADYYRAKLECDPDNATVRKIANIIAWNFWQMDGITGTIPFGKPEEEYTNFTIFDYGIEVPNADEASEMVEHGQSDTETPVCRIFDWRSNESVKFTDLKKG